LNKVEFKEGYKVGEMEEKEDRCAAKNGLEASKKIQAEPAIHLHVKQIRRELTTFFFFFFGQWD
jgi:hypothetical protein